MTSVTTRWPAADNSTEKGTSTLMTALTRTEARELSRRFAEVGVDVSPGGSNKSVATAR